MIRDRAAVDLLKGLPPDDACIALLEDNRVLLEEICAQLLAQAASSGVDYAFSFQTPALEDDLVSLGLGGAFARENTVWIKIAEGGGWRKTMAFYEEEVRQSADTDSRPTEVQLAEVLDANPTNILDFPQETAWSVISARIRGRIRSGPQDPAKVLSGRTIVVPTWIKSRYVCPHWRIRSKWDAADWQVSQRSPILRLLCGFIDPHGVDIYARPSR